MALYQTTFPVAAPAPTVWAVLTDFERYGEWNPSLPSIRGEVRPGAEVAVTLGLPGRPSPKVKARLGRVEPDRCLTWDGNAGADWLFSGHREFVIEPGGADVMVTHVEDVRGALFPVFRLVMGSAIQRSHDAFNDALTERCERIAAS